MGKEKLLEIYNQMQWAGQVWWHTPLIPALQVTEREDHKLEASLADKVRPWLNE